MLEQLFSINLAFIVFGLTLIEKGRLNRILTPFTMSAWPFLFICLSANFLFIYLGFKPITARVQLFILANLLIIWLIGWFVGMAYQEKLHENQGTSKQKIFKEIAKYQLFIITLSWIIIILNYGRISEIVDTFGGIWIIGSEKYEKLMAQGLVSHLVELGKVCFILLIFSFRYAKSKLLTGITLLALFFNTGSVMVKYHLIWLITISFLFYVWDRPARQQIKYLAILVFVLFFVMNSFWIFLTIVWGTFGFDNEYIWLFFSRLFVNYLISGPIVLDFWLDLGFTKPDWTLFVVFKNIWNVVTGNPIRIEAVPLTSTGFFQVGPGSTSNVGTSFGVYYLIGGYALAFAVTTVFALTSYLLYFESIIKNSKILVFLNLLLLNVALFSFFGQYFTSFTFYEMSIMFMMIVFILKSSDLIGDLLKYNKNRPLFNLLFFNKVRSKT